MRILIDMQACQNGSRFRGIGRYTLGIVTALLKLPRHEHDYHLLLNGMFEDNLAELIAHFSKLIPSQNIHIWHGIGPTEGCNPQNKNRREIAELLRHYFIENLKVDALFLPTFFEGSGDHTVLSIPKNRSYKTYATCHDLIPLVQSDIYLETNKIFKDYYLNQVKEYKNADGYLAVSESSKNELIQYINIAPKKIVNTLEGIESQFKKSNPSTSNIEKILGNKLNNRKIILYFGASDERKNHLKLIKAFSLLSQETRAQSILVLAGIGVPQHAEKFQKYAAICGLNRKEFVIVGRITDDEVIDLYSYSYLFVFPSFHEGFGLPALEAMACGTAVITANTTSLPEVVGREDLTFNPYSSISIQTAIEKFILDEQYRNEVAAYCLTRSKAFSWEKSASTALAFIESGYTSTQPNSGLKSTKTVDQLLQEIKTRKLAANLTYVEKEQLTLSVIKNFRSPRKPRLLYDVSKLIAFDYVTGVQRVTIEVLKQLQRLYSTRFEVIPVKVSEDGQIIEEVQNHKVSRRKNQRLSVSDLLDLRPGDIYLNIDLDHAAPNKHRAYTQMRLKGCKTHFIVHDLLPMELGDSFFGEHSAYHHYNWLKEVAHADALICVSHTVMESVNFHLNSIPKTNPELQLGWFHLGANFDFPKSSTKVSKPINTFKKINFNQPVFLMVGSVEPRKGHLEVLETITELWDQGFKGSLIITGARGWSNDLIIEIVKSSQYKDKLLFWPDTVSDDELDYLYRNSTALIAGSLGEGFGLPLIEAMQHGIPVIARDIPVFREISQNQAKFFKTPEDLKKIILNTKGSLKQDAFKYQSWEQSTQQLMNVILNNQYDVEWKENPNAIILPICSDKFGTSCGHNTKDRIRTNEQAGLFVWGGYFPIDQGTYTLKIYGKSSHKQSIRLELVTYIDGQQKVLFKRVTLPVSTSSGKYDIAEEIVNTNISIPTSVKDCEIYIRVTDENHLSISRFEFSKESDRPYYMFNLSEDDFTSTVGLQNEHGIYTQNNEGVLLQGGNLNLDAGKYTLEIFGSAPLSQNINFSIGYLDEFNTQQSHVEFKTLKIEQTKDSTLTKKTFTLKQAIKNAEFFVNVNEHNKLKLSEVKLMNH